MTAPDAQGKRRPGLSLRLKLTLWIVLIAGIIQLTLVVLAVFYLRLTLADSFDQRLQASARDLAASVSDRQGRLTDPELAALADEGQRSAGFEKLAVVLYDQSGAAVASTLRPAPAAADLGVDAALASLTAGLSRREVPGFGSEGEGYPARITLQPLAAPDGRRMVLLVAATDRTYQAILVVTGRVLAVALPAGILAAAVAGWLIGGIAIAPLEQVRRLTLSLAPETLGHPHTEPLGRFREAAELERALEETRAKLNYAFQAQDRFIANVSHELKTPIAVVLAEAQVLARENLSPAAGKFAQSTIEEMLRLATMIEKFLTLTKIKKGSGIPNAQPMDINAVAMEAVVNSRKMAAQFRVELVPRLADSERPVQVLGDAEQLQLMLVNLLHNSIRFSPPGKPVIVAVAQEGDQCRISVRDFGLPVPAALVSTLFDRFSQDPGEGKRGHGVGLAIAQGVAELHGGRITVSNHEEGGCEFCVRLPLAPAPAPAD